MSQAHVHSPVDEAAYLRGEETAASKHEFVGGEIYAMAGANERHNRIAGNIFFHLRSATRGKPCRAFVADMKLRLAGGTTYYYPDAMLVCDPDDDHPIYKQSPCPIAEVLTPATATVDYEDTGLLVV
jgi:Uma2 family endonuclease